jgi:hypothetical protein
MQRFTQDLPGGVRASRSRARVIRPALRDGELVQAVVECFAPPIAATTWPLLPFFAFALLVNLPYGLVVAAIILGFGAALYRLTSYCFVATDQSLLVVRYGKLIDGTRGTVVKRVARGTEIGRPYLFNVLGVSVQPAWWQFPVLHSLHMSVLFVGFRVDDIALWTAKGNARKLKKLRGAAA